jgi:hypothetical protein
MELANRAHEERLLRELCDAARAASVGETKLRALGRLLRRVREPALIFTEYRDTLMHLRGGLSVPAGVLHGGLDRADRTAVLADFAAGRCRILLATDAAGEGLNLHHVCRLVINLELPWNPMRLEQRIGRVDRIGQSRTVHVVHLIARQTGEPQLLDRLKARLVNARLDIAVPDPLGATDAPLQADAGTAGEFLQARAAAVVEARRLADARRCQADPGTLPWAEGPWMIRTRHRVTRERLAGFTILIFLAAFEDGWGRVVEWTLIPARLKIPVEHLNQIEWDLLPEIQNAADGWRTEASQIVNAFAGWRLKREDAIARGLVARTPSELQPGLFDRRAEAAFALETEALRGEAREHDARIARLEQAARLSFRTRLLLALSP